METHLLGTDWDRHSSEAGAPLCSVSVNTEWLCVCVCSTVCVCVCVKNNDWHLCVYILLLLGGAADLWWWADWTPWFTAPAKPGYRWTLAHTCTCLRCTNTCSTQCRIRMQFQTILASQASVYLITSITAKYIIQFINSVAHVNWIPIKTQSLPCRSAREHTIYNIFSMRRHPETHCGQHAVSFCLWYL